ncbi:MAG TPA: hypothetical protein VGR26_00475 [Acidimicrobiales bacterium]|nr:hypothetical protein [Acidimicrobiales bacterium]
MHPVVVPGLAPSRWVIMYGMGSVTRHSPAGRIARLLLEAAAVVVGVVHLLFGPANF